MTHRWFYHGWKGVLAAVIGILAVELLDVKFIMYLLTWQWWVITLSVIFIDEFIEYKGKRRG